jgi:hypothetical protein
MPLLSKRRQFSVIKETTGGIRPSGFPSAAQSGLVLIDATAALDVENIERNVLRDSLTPVKGTVGQQAATFTVTTEIAGSNGGAFSDGAPLWGELMQGCGYEQVAVKEVLVGAITDGPFQHGELVTLTTGTMTGFPMVVMDAHDGDGKITFKSSDGDPIIIPNAAVILGSSSGAEATVTVSGVSTDSGYAWSPISNIEKSMDVVMTGGQINAGALIEGAGGARAVVTVGTALSAGTIKMSPIRNGPFAANEVLTVLSPGGGGNPTGFKTATGSTNEEFTKWPSVSLNFNEDGQNILCKGARGNVAFNFEVNRPATATFTMRGVLSSTFDSPALTGITSDAPSSPPIWQGSAAGWVENETSANTATTAEYLPCLTSLQIDAGVTLADRKCASAATGLVEILGTGRAGTGSIDPEVTLESDIPWLTYAKAGTTARLRVPLGSVDGNQFTFFMPGVQMDSPSYGDRDGIATHDIPFRLTGGFHHNVNGAGTKLDVFGGDNELVILYHTS